MARRRGRRGSNEIEWNFFSFPVVFAVAGGALLAMLVSLFLGYQATFTVALFCFSFGIAHIVGHTIRRRRLDTSLERAEEDEKERRILAARAAAQREAAAEEGPRPRRRRRRRS